ncbi:MAG: tRNA threonylcarbamoyladenosine dehydratase [Ruminococcaceae bacterium]|nr:tRNA threonylcarbamoyladenosine dehydratase [Oscillospiraceae bacterium]
MDEQFSRSALLLGKECMYRIFRAKIAVFGVGGVGGQCVDALARSGVGALHLYDDDTVSKSNLNRQIAALHSTLGRPKAQVMAERVWEINPSCDVQAIRMFYLPSNADQVDLSQYDYVVDCIDTVSAKLELICRCTDLNIPVISAMGTGNKLDPSALQVSDISKTSGCPLARVMRKELRKRGIAHLKVVWSTEDPRKPLEQSTAETPLQSETRPGSTARRDTPGSLPFVPAAAGLLLASAVIRDLIEE